MNNSGVVKMVASHLREGTPIFAPPVKPGKLEDRVLFLQYPNVFLAK
jgi:hypothetical protein